MTATLDTAFDETLAKVQQEQSTTDQATEPKEEAKVAETAQQPTEEKGQEPAPSTESSDNLLDQETYDSLKSKPEELRKALNKAFTVKTQELAEQRKQLEPYLELANALRENPKDTLKELEKRFGLDKQEPVAPKNAEAAVDAVKQSLVRVLGPESTDLVDALTSSIREAVKEAIPNVLKTEVEPLKKQVQDEQARAAAQEVKSNLEVFSKEHPDWQKYEQKMLELSQKFQPSADPVTGEYPTWKEYMDSLYLIATAGTKKADIVKETIKRMEESAKKSEQPDASVNSSHVAKSAPKFTNFNEAFQKSFEDARSGVVYER